MFTRSSEKKIRSINGRRLKQKKDAIKMRFATDTARKIMLEIIGIDGVCNIIGEYVKPIPIVKCVFIEYDDQKRCMDLLSQVSIKYAKKDFELCKRHRRIINSDIYVLANQQ